MLRVAWAQVGGSLLGTPLQSQFCCGWAGLSLRPHPHVGCLAGAGAAVAPRAFLSLSVWSLPRVATWPLGYPHRAESPGGSCRSCVTFSALAWKSCSVTSGPFCSSRRSKRPPRLKGRGRHCLVEGASGNMQTQSSVTPSISALLALRDGLGTSQTPVILMQGFRGNGENIWQQKPTLKGKKPLLRRRYLKSQEK